MIVRFLCISPARSGALYQAVRHKCVPPTRPTAAPARAIALAGTALLLTVSLPTLVLSRNSAEKFFGFAQQIFRALDNDVSLKSKHARSGLPLRALVAPPSAEVASADYSPRRSFGGHKKTLAQIVRRTQRRSIKLLVPGVMCWLPLLPFGLSSPVSD